MTPTSRASRAGQVYLDLKRLAHDEHRPTQEYFELYALEGSLERLASSDYAPRMILKGGMLLAALGVRRPTRDIDMHAEDLANDTQTTLNMAREVASIPLADGLVFATESAVAEVIRDEDEYSGVRVSMDASLARAALKFHVDVNVGDPIWPAPAIVQIPRLLGTGSISMRGYPLPMVFAEKIVTALQRGTANTRWRDFGDIWTLSRHHDQRADELHQALTEVAKYRTTELQAMSEALEGYPALAQVRWAAWRKRKGMTSLPESFAQVLDDVVAFADPVVTRTVEGAGTWNHETGTWT